jgi:hypothetical protein
VLGFGVERDAVASGAQIPHPSRPATTRVPTTRMRTHRQL